MDDETKYTIVWVVLVVLTLLEVQLIGLNLIYTLIILSILIVAGVKAILVAGFFQHLFYDNRYIAIFYASSVFMIVAIILTWIFGV